MLRKQLQDHLQELELAALNGSFYSSCFSDSVQDKISIYQIKIDCYKQSSQLLVKFQSYEERMTDWGECLQSEILDEVKSASGENRLADVEEIWIYPGLCNRANRLWSRG